MKVNRNTIATLFVPVLLVLLNACAEKTSNELAEAVVQPETTLESEVLIRVAEPQEYQPAPDESLGVNANGKGLERGHNISEFTITDLNNQPYKISNAWSKKPALVIFYRGGWCPYCNAQIRDLAVNHERIANTGVEVVAISVDEIDKAILVGAKYNIPFSVLSDPDLIAHKAFNVVMEIDAETLKKYEEFGVNLQEWSGRDHNSIGIASVFLVDNHGRVLVSHAPEDYKTRPTVDQVITMIEANLTQNTPSI